MDDLLAAPITLSIGRALLHFVWQGALVGLTLAVALRALAGSRPTIRYAVACAGLVAMLAAPVATFFTEDDLFAPARSVNSVSHAGVETQGVAEAAAPSASLSLSPSAGWTLPMAVLVWMAGVLLLSLRLMAGWYNVARLQAATVPVDASLSARVRALAERLGVARAVRVCESAAVQVPTLVGGLRPVILLPASAITSLPVAYLDAVIAHELAHVRRYDYLVNIGQVVVETLLFYHPAVWWCSTQMRIEREHCCDDIVVGAFTDRVGYARALAMLEERRGDQPTLSLAATGGRLLDRIRRVLMVVPTTDRRSPAWVISLLALALSAAVAGPVVWTGTPTVLSAAVPDDAADSPGNAEAPEQDVPAPPAPPALRAPVAAPSPVAPQVPRAPVAAPAWAPDVDWADYVRETQAALEILAEETGGIFVQAPPQPALPPLAPLPADPGAVHAPPAVPAAPAPSAPAAIPLAAPAPAPPLPPAPPAAALQDGFAQFDSARVQIERARQQLERARLELARQQEQLRMYQEQIERQRQDLQRAEAQLAGAGAAQLEQQKALAEMQRKVLEQMYRRSEALRADGPEAVKLREQIEAMRQQLEAVRKQLEALQEPRF